MILHVTRRRLRTEEKPPQIDVHDAVPVILRRLHRRSPGRYPRVVRQDIETPHVTYRPFKHARNPGGLGHIKPVTVRISARHLDLLTHGVNPGLLGRDVGNGDTRTGTGKTHCDGAAYPLGGAGHERTLAIEPE